jgi:hypothetical protein
MEETIMKVTFGTLAIAASTFACALSFSPTMSGQDGWSLTSQAEARARVYIHGGTGGYYTATGLPWYAVRAYYFGGPWSGPYYSYAGWSDYAGRNGIGCTPGTVVKGGDGILYNCQ